MTKFKGIGALILMTICAALIAKYLYPGLVPILNQDSYQYLSVADNALHGKIGYTSIIHFDTERSLGTMPAPLVTFPPGYALVTALVSRIGISTETAGLALSVAATLACIPLLIWLGARAGFSGMLSCALAGLFVTNATVIVFGASVMTEALFMLLSLLGVACIMQAKVRNQNGLGWYWVAAGLSFAAAYFARYAGMFFVAGLFILVIYYAVTANRAMMKGHFIALLISGSAVLSAAARNIYLVGNWRGGNDKVVSNPLLQTIGKALQGTNVLLLGPGSGSPGGTTLVRLACILLFLGGMVLLLTAGLRWSKTGGKGEVRTQYTPIATEIAILSAVYMACLFYAGLKSVIDYGDPRYFLPVAPLFFLLVGIFITRWGSGLRVRPSGLRTAAFAFLSASAAICIGLNLLLFRLPNAHAASPLEVDFATSKVGEAQFSAKIRDLVGPDGVVISNNGQNVAHVVARPTISLVGPTFSSVEWTEQALRDVATQFRAKAIVIYVPEGEQWNDDNYIPSSFIRRLANNQPPQWMKLEFRSKHLLVYVPSISGDAAWAAAQ